MQQLIISHITIRQDDAGRFCLNDLHKVAGGEKRHTPSYWLKSQQTQALIAEIVTTGNSVLEQNQPVKVINGGNKQGV